MLDRDERLGAELAVLGMDTSRHLMDDHHALLKELGVRPARRLTDARHGETVLVAGAKVATQTPPIRSGNDVVAAATIPRGAIQARKARSLRSRFARTVQSHTWRGRTAAMSMATVATPAHPRACTSWRRTSAASSTNNTPIMSTVRPGLRLRFRNASCR